RRSDCRWRVRHDAAPYGDDCEGARSNGPDLDLAARDVTRVRRSEDASTGERMAEDRAGRGAGGSGAGVGRKSGTVATIDDLLAPFYEALKPARSFVIGAEAEKFGVDAFTGAALPYDGERSVVAVLQALVERHAWRPEQELDGGPLIALARGDASV